MTGIDEWEAERKDLELQNQSLYELPGSLFDS
jgi:hypothetical protein